MIGYYLMYAYTAIQINLYAFWMYCFENGIVIYWLRNLMYEIRSRTSSYKIEPNCPYMCICSGENEFYIPLNKDRLECTFSVLANSVPHTEGVERLILMRVDKRLVSRINKESYYDVDFFRSRKHFLSIEYTHPDMKERLVIELDPAVYLTGNEILSARFVLRCLQYQPDDYVFDDRYVLDIMDSKIRMLTLTAGEYILIGNTEYEKKGIKI